MGEYSAFAHDHDDAVANQLDRPSSVAKLSKGADSLAENSGAQGVLDEASRHRAEAQYFNFYELHGEPDPNAQGTADFN